MSTSTLLDAIRVVKENERIACKSYSEAANTIRHSMGKQLFNQLSKFESYHYKKLAILEKSLLQKGEYITYAGKSFPLPPKFEIVAAQETDKKSVMQIISEAIQLEKMAEKAYADLADQLDEPQGRQMFLRLSEEEHNHYRILNEAYWTLSDFGIWKWTRI